MNQTELAFTIVRNRNIKRIKFNKSDELIALVSQFLYARNVQFQRMLCLY